jgi:hypothetical protein
MRVGGVQMRRVMVVAVMLAGGCDGAPRPTMSPAQENEAKRQAAAAKAASVKEPEKTMADVIADRLIAGTLTDSDVMSLNVEAAKSSAITFAHLKKNADRYKGKFWRFTGKIIEIGESGGRTKARVALDSYGQNVIFVEAPFETEFVDGARVEVMGLLTGSFSYTSQAGWNISIPSMLAARITKAKSTRTPSVVLKGLQPVKD